MKKTLSIVIPVYNEESRLEKAFLALSEKFPSTKLLLLEVIFVNDGSTDTTLKVLNDWQKKQQGFEVKIISYRNNCGKGGAIKRGLLKATGDYALFMDVDMSTPLTEFTKFEKWIGKYEVIIGTRKNGHSTVVVPQPIHRQLLGRGFTVLTQLALNTWVTDFTCGFKLLSKSAYLPIARLMRIDRWSYDAEMMFLAKKLGLSIKEVPVKWYNDRRTKVSLVKDIAQSFVDLVKIRQLDINGGYENTPRYCNLIERAFSWIKIDW